MKRIGYSGLAWSMVIAIGLLWSAVALAQGDGRTCPGNTIMTPVTEDTTRIFNDCPFSNLVINDNYPVSIVMSDQDPNCQGYANLHTWSFSPDGNVKYQFENCSHYRFCADVQLSGTGDGEGGLRISPWWSPNADGKFMLNTVPRPLDPAHDREIAVFSGRLPFFSFTTTFGLHYNKGDVVHLEMIYDPGHLAPDIPAKVTYNLTYGINNYTSGPLAFDQGNPSEDPPHGLWGELYPAYAGGFFQPYGPVANGTAMNLTASFTNICYEALAVVPTSSTTWGHVKTIYR